MSGALLHVVGARPQFVKAAAVLRAARLPERHQILHTGQHGDVGLSDVFFQELAIQPPSHNLGITGGTHGAQTGRFLDGIEQVLLKDRPDAVVIYGDTNSTLAGALAAAKLGIPLIHIEAGLRAFERHMPEEINRVVADRLSDVLLCPTARSVRWLELEGLTRGVQLVGDVMLDIALRERPRATATPIARYLAGDRRGPPPEAIDALGFPCGPFILATLHRAANTDDPARLRRLLAALGDVATRFAPVVWPLHPRTRNALARSDLALPPGVVPLPPQGYHAFAALLLGAEAVVTDSGGVQKEAFFAARRCVTLRDRTEWEETLEGGWNRLAGDEPEGLYEALSGPAPTAAPDLAAFGDGRASERCVAAIEGHAHRPAP